MTNPIIMPVEIDDVSMAFPADALEYMPAWEDIPEEFRTVTDPSAMWHDFAHTWFYQGLHPTYTGWLGVELDDGTLLQGELISRQISAILGSYAPKHQHKMAAVAYLLSLWIDSAVYGPFDCKKEDLKTIGDFILDEWLEHVDSGGETVG